MGKECYTLKITAPIYLQMQCIKTALLLKIRVVRKICFNSCKSTRSNPRN
jgi:hypothetical protein